MLGRWIINRYFIINNFAHFLVEHLYKIIRLIGTGVDFGVESEVVVHGGVDEAYHTISLIKSVPSILGIRVGVEIFIVEKDCIKCCLLIARIRVQMLVHFKAKEGEYHDQTEVKDHTPGENAKHLIKLDGAQIEPGNKRNISLKQFLFLLLFPILFHHQYRVYLI